MKNIQLLLLLLFIYFQNLGKNLTFLLKKDEKYGKN